MIKLFTHTDLDGVGCAILAQLAFKEKVDISYCNYDSIDKEVEDFIFNNKDINNFDKYFITDISISEELADRINNNIDNIYLFDHHVTALNLNKYDWCTVKVEDENTHIKTCGTELLFLEYLNNNINYNSNILSEIIKFVEIVRNYDTWRWAELGDEGIISKKVNDLLYLFGRKEFINWTIKKILSGTFGELDHTDNTILNVKQNEINEYIKKKNKELNIVNIYNKRCGLVFAEQYTSELGNTLCKMNPDIDFVAIVDMGIKVISFRTIKDDINLGKDIAKKFGGGGHPKAAGAPFSNEIVKNTIIDILLKGIGEGNDRESISIISNEN